MLTVASPVAVATNTPQIAINCLLILKFISILSLSFPFQTNEQVSVRTVIGAKQQIGSQTATTNKK